MNPKKMIYLPRCPFCGELTKNGEPCAKCLKEATEFTEEVCGICGSALDRCCCHTNRHRFTFRRNVCCYPYVKAPRTLLLRFKQRYKPQLAPFIVRRMVAQIRGRLTGKFSCVAFVPQTYLKDILRGYCPTYLLAKGIAEELGLPCVNLLRRKGNTSQKYATGSRWANAKKNYCLRKNAKTSGRVLLIDDLFTSGATLSACAALLKKAGAQEVYTATFAIAVKKS